MKFIIIDGSLLRNKAISAEGKLIISYLFNLGKCGKCFFGSYEYMADVLGIEEIRLTKIIRSYLSENLFVMTPEGLTLGRDLNYFCTFSKQALDEFKASQHPIS